MSTAENGQIAFDLITGEGRTPASEAGEPSPAPLGQSMSQVQSQAPAMSDATASMSTSQDGGTPPAVENAKPAYEGGPRYELVFLDNQMPVLSGLDLVTKLRQMGRTDFVVGVTGTFAVPCCFLSFSWSVNDTLLA